MLTTRWSQVGFALKLLQDKNVHRYEVSAFSSVNSVQLPEIHLKG